MLSIEIARALSSNAEELILEEHIDRKILNKAEQGKYSCTIILQNNANSCLLQMYKNILVRYTMYKISYGINHNGDNLITIKWNKYENVSN